MWKLLMYDKPHCLQRCIIFFGKDPQVLVWTSLGVIHVKIAIYSMRNHLNYR